jgi:DNA-binding GntR family transcriptional regulator
LLSEGEVAAEVGVSRTPVREALLRLETEGLVRLYPKRGALVLPVSTQEISDVLETRELVETFTAGRATIGPELVAELTRLLEAMREHSGATDAKEFARADRCFHRTLVAAAGNEILTQLYDSLRDRQLRMARLTASDPVRAADAIRDHSEILEALRSGDRRRIRAAIHRHLQTAGVALHSRS